MDSSKLHDWLQIVGLVAVVGSLIFVGLQLKQAEDIALAEAVESTATRGIELRALIASHTDTWQKACRGQELNKSEKLIAANIYFSYLQSNFNTWVRYETTGIGGINSRYLIDAYAANLHRYPGFRQIALSFADWSEVAVRWDDRLVDEYRSAVRQRVAELEQAEPNPAADVMWCGVR